MSDEAVLLVVLGLAALFGVALAQARQIYLRGGARQFVWPRFRTGYEITNATRLACAPWLVLLTVCVLNAVTVAWLEEDLLGRPGDRFWLWLIPAAPAAAAVHLLLRRHSRVVAALSAGLVAVVCLGLLWLAGPGLWLPLAVPLVLWTINGVRATIVGAAMG